MERLRRFWCKVVGHRWVVSKRGAPVVPWFNVCARCGKWEHRSR